MDGDDRTFETADGLLGVDREHRIVLWNEAAEALFGFTAKEALGRPCYEVTCARDESGKSVCQSRCRHIMMALRGERIPSHDVLVRTKERREVWVNMSTVLLPARRKDPLVLLHLFRDANQQKARDRFFEQIAAGVAKLATAGEPDPPGAPSTSSPPADLTPREREVLRPLASGASNRAIATKLGISPATARNHVHHVLAKLRVQSRAEAVSLALRNGLT